MTEQEFLADLATKVLYMGEPQPFNDQDNVNMTVSIVEMGQRGTVKPPRNFHYVVLNRGVAAGPDVDPLFAENAYATQPIELPVTDALKAVEYLEAQQAAGSWNHYEYESGRADLGFFIAKVWVDNGDGTLSEKRVIVSYDDQGTPTHKELV